MCHIDFYTEKLYIILKNYEGGERGLKKIMTVKFVFSPSCAPHNETTAAL